MHFFVGWGERNGEQALGSRWTGSRKAAGPSAPQPGREKPAGPRPRAASPAQRSTPGARSWDGRAPGWRSRPSRGRRLRAVRGSRAPRGGSARTLAGTAARSGLSAKPAGGGQWGGCLVSRGASTPTSATSSPPRCPAAPSPPHFQRRLSPRQQERAEAGTACGRKVRPQGIFSSRGERCNPRLPPHPPQSTPLVYLGRRQGGGKEEEPGRTRTRKPAPGEVSAGRFALTPEPSQDASGEDGTSPAYRSGEASGKSLRKPSVPTTLLIQPTFCSSEKPKFT